MRGMRKGRRCEDCPRILLPAAAALCSDQGQQEKWGKLNFLEDTYQYFQDGLENENMRGNKKEEEKVGLKNIGRNPCVAGYLGV